MSVNVVHLIGNLTRDVELRFTQSNKAVAQLGLALNETWKDAEGNKKESVTFVDCEVWGAAAEFAGKYLAKGRLVYIQGRLKLDQWEDKKNGEKRSKLKVMVDRLEALGGKPDDGKAQRPTPTARANPTPASVDDDSPPF